MKLLGVFALLIVATNAQNLHVIRKPELMVDPKSFFDKSPGSSSGNIRCPKFCTDRFKPVADEEGILHSNECMMRWAKCKGDKKDPIILHSVLHSAGARPGTSLIKKKCPEICPDVENPVCGSDGVKYGNPCELKVAACKHPEINIVEDSGTACFGTNKKHHQQ